MRDEAGRLARIWNEGRASVPAFLDDFACWIEATLALSARARLVQAPTDAVVVAVPGSAPPAGLAPSWLAGREPQGGRPTAWICRGVTCSLPILDPDAIASEPAALR
jgi:uncharacterized protein YyaL (SSP411 family)